MAEEDRDSKPILAPPTGREPQNQEPSLRAHTFEALKYDDVLVRASGFHYRGQLIGADEEDLYLKTATRWVVLPLERITSIHVDDGASRPLGLPDVLESLLAASEES